MSDWEGSRCAMRSGWPERERRRPQACALFGDPWLSFAIPWRCKLSRALARAEVGEPLLILILYLALWIGIIKIGGWKLSPNVGIALMAAQGFYTTWTLLRNVPVDAPIIDW